MQEGTSVRRQQRTDRQAPMIAHLELHDVGVLAALAEVQQLPAQHLLAVLPPRNESAAHAAHACQHPQLRSQCVAHTACAACKNLCVDSDDMIM